MVSLILTQKTEITTNTLILIQNIKVYNRMIACNYTPSIFFWLPRT